MKKKLVFSFYISNDWETNIANLCHFECLKEYSSVFDEIEIYIATDNKKDYENIIKVKKIFFDIFKHNESLLVEVIDNTLYRESLIVKKYIFDKLGKDDYVFFGHNKGITNITSQTYPEKYVLKWIIDCYYYSLGFIDEVVNAFSNDNNALSYGSFLEEMVLSEDIEITKLQKYKWYYCGTFYWIHSKRLRDFIERNNIELPELADRYYSENVLGNLFPIHINTHYYAFSHSLCYCLKYGMINSDIENFFLYAYPEHSDFDEFFNKICNKINK